MTDPSSLIGRARAAVQEVARERAKRGTQIPAEQVERSAVLLANLWSAAAPLVTPGGWGWTNHLPRAALDSVIGESRPPRGGSKR